MLTAWECSCGTRNSPKFPLCRTCGRPVSQGRAIHMEDAPRPAGRSRSPSSPRGVPSPVGKTPSGPEAAPRAGRTPSGATGRLAGATIARETELHPDDVGAEDLVLVAPAKARPNYARGVALGLLLAGILMFAANQAIVREWFLPKTGSYIEHRSMVRIGMTQDEVRLLCGPPQFTDRSARLRRVREHDLPLAPQEYWYYDGRYQLVFEEGRLVAVNEF